MCLIIRHAISNRCTIFAFYCTLILRLLKNLWTIPIVKTFFVLPGNKNYTKIYIQLDVHTYILCTGIVLVCLFYAIDVTND